MKTKHEQKSNPNQQMMFEIKIKGHLGSQWEEWFEGLTITLEDDGNTLLSGLVIDQAALHGLLKKIRDLGMPLVSVIQVQFNDSHPISLTKGEQNEH